MARRLQQHVGNWNVPIVTLVASISQFFLFWKNEIVRLTEIPKKSKKSMLAQHNMYIFSSILYALGPKKTLGKIVKHSIASKLNSQAHKRRAVTVNNNSNCTSVIDMSDSSSDSDYIDNNSDNDTNSDSYSNSDTDSTSFSELDDGEVIVIESDEEKDSTQGVSDVAGVVIELVEDVIDPLP